MQSGLYSHNMTFKHVLAIETSCDDTSVAVVNHEGVVKALCSAHQDLVHRPFGGVVPEIAGRNHSLNLLPLMDECLKKAMMDWSQIDGICVTSRPGLVSSLLVGVVTAKTLALAKNLPFLGVNHLEAHLLAPFLKDDQYAPPADFTYPYLALAISGGHTQLYNVEGLGHYRILGQTIDDAAGEAFDKFAKRLSLGFPGGIKVDQLAKKGDVRAFDFPRPLMHADNYQFSFSGLKSAAQRLIDKMSDEEVKKNKADLCASYQEAIVDVLIYKIEKAVENFALPKVVLTGGVSANSRLREKSEAWAKKKNLKLVIPPIRYCTDNAAMVGYVGVQRMNRGETSEQNLKPSPKVYPEDFCS